MSQDTYWDSEEQIEGRNVRLEEDNCPIRFEESRMLEAIETRRRWHGAFNGKSHKQQTLRNSMAAP